MRGPGGALAERACLLLKPLQCECIRTIVYVVWGILPAPVGLTTYVRTYVRTAGQIYLAGMMRVTSWPPLHMGCLQYGGCKSVSM